MGRARQLRNDATGCERKVWRWLRELRRSHDLHVRRQVPIGPYIADFGCHAARLIVEIDGRGHDAEADAARDAWFTKAGYKTVRFSNWQVLNAWDEVVRTLESEFRLLD